MGTDEAWHVTPYDCICYAGINILLGIRCKPNEHSQIIHQGDCHCL